MVIIKSGEEESQQSELSRKRRRDLQDAGPWGKQTEAEEVKNVRRTADDDHYVFKIGENLTERYEIRRVLGEGTFCRVLECWDSKKEDYVAIKVIRNNEICHFAALYEVAVLQHLAQNDEGNLHFVQMQNCFSYQKHPCIVFEKLGPSLDDLLVRNKNCPLPMDLVRVFAFQLLESVANLHDCDAIHTDVKPRNILLVSDLELTPGREKTSGEINLRFMPKAYDIKLIDFGSTVTKNLITKAIVSTRDYRAPEVILVLGWSFPCDVWSIGCTLLELCLGAALFVVDEDSEHLAMMERVLGPLPEDMMRTAKEKFQALPDTEAVRKLDSLQNLILRRGRPSSSSLLGLLQALLRFDPSERPTARDALDHQFFKDRT